MTDEHQIPSTRQTSTRQTIDLTLFELLAQSRRTSLRVDPLTPVPRELVERLCRLAMWSPNHKKTWPWRFGLCVDGGRARFGETMADALHSAGLDDEARLAKYRQKYLRAPAVLVIGSAPGDSEIRTIENRDAVASGVQNLLLGATAAGLASFWSSGAIAANGAVADLFGWDPGTAIVAVVYLGWPTGEVNVPSRPAPDIAVLGD